MFRQQLGDDGLFCRRWLTSESATPRPGNARAVVRSAFRKNAHGKSARRFDIGRVVEQRQRLLWCIRARAFTGAFFPRRCIEGEQAWLQERALPPGVQTTAIRIFTLVVRPFSLREIEMAPIARRLVRFHAGSANFLHQQSADGQGIIAHEFGVETEHGLM